jgi:galactonate dehydratase
MITGDIRLKQATRRSSVYNAKVADYIAIVKAVREAVGDDFDMILECHRSMDPMEALAFAKGVEEYRPLFLEDPIPPDSPEAMADIAARTNIPVATGERFINIQEFETIFQKRAAKYVRPDVCALGGLTPSKKVAAMAEANYCKIVPHNPLGPVSTAACLQLDAAIPNFAIQEFPSFYHQGNEAEMTREPLEEESGYIIIPDQPGIGIELVDDITERFPPKPRSISAQIAFDGSVYDV